MTPGAARERKRARDRARYATDEYREWNRARMRRYRDTFIGDHRYYQIEAYRAMKRRLVSRIVAGPERIAEAQAELEALVSHDAM